MTREEKSWCALCHISALSSFLGIPFGNILGPLVVWLIKRKSSTFINQHGKEALNYQISLTVHVFLFAVILIAFGAIVAEVSVGVPVSDDLFMFILGLLIAFFCIIAILAFIAVLVLPIMGSIKAVRGEMFRYPATVRILE